MILTLLASCQRVSLLALAHCYHRPGLARVSILESLPSPLHFSHLYHLHHFYHSLRHPSLCRLSCASLPDALVIFFGLIFVIPLISTSSTTVLEILPHLGGGLDKPTSCESGRQHTPVQHWRFLHIKNHLQHNYYFLFNNNYFLFEL